MVTEGESKDERLKKIGSTFNDIIKRAIVDEISDEKDMEALNVKPATTHPKATCEIDGMIDMISTLIEKGHAYVADRTLWTLCCGNLRKKGNLSGQHPGVRGVRGGISNVL